MPEKFPNRADRGYALFSRAQALRDAGNPLRARRLCLRALRLLESSLGPRHPDVGNVLLEISGCFEDCGDHLPALEPCTRALSILNHVRCGLDGYRLKFLALISLGRLQTTAGDYRQARQLWKRALRLAEKSLTRDEISSAHNGLGVVSRHLDAWDQAEAHYRQALASSPRPRHPLALATLYHNLAGLEHARGRFARGIPLALRGLRWREAALGNDHVSIAADKAALASLYEGRGDLEKAESLYQEAIALFRRTYGPRHAEVGFNLGNLAAIAFQRGQFDLAANLYKESLLIQEKTLGPEHPNLATLLENFAQLRVAEKRYEEAVLLQDRAMTICRKVFGDRHQRTGEARWTREEILHCAGHTRAGKLRADVRNWRALRPISD